MSHATPSARKVQFLGISPFRHVNDHGRGRDHDGGENDGVPGRRNEPFRRGNYRYSWEAGLEEGLESLTACGRPCSQWTAL